MGRSLVALFNHPWFVVAAGALTLAGVVTGIAQGLLDFTTIPLVSTLVGAFMLSLSGAAYSRRHLTPALEGRAAALEDPSAFTTRYSDWLLGVKAALPDPDTARTVDYLYIPMNDEHREQQQAEIASASRVYRQTYDEEERKARAEYHKTYRVGALAIVGEGHERARNPYSIKDLEAVEKLLLAAKPLSPGDVAAFKHFARDFGGWFKGEDVEAPRDPSEFPGQEYEDEAINDLIEGAISAEECERKMEPFTERRKWERTVRAKYLRDWRANAIRWVEWARESGAMENEDIMALFLVENPQADDLKELTETVERIAKRL